MALTFLLIIVLYPESGLGSNNLIIGSIAILANLINSVFLIIKIIFIVITERNITFGSKFYKLVLSIIMPILAIISVPILEYSASYMFVITMNKSLVQQIPSKSNQSFKYGRFKLSKLSAHGGPWVIYDESEQVILPAQSRSQEWWQVSNESDEAESVGCWSPARRLYNHFFIRYFNC
jgi:hypothetical protein